MFFSIIRAKAAYDFKILAKETKQNTNNNMEQSGWMWYCFIKSTAVLRCVFTNVKYMCHSLLSFLKWHNLFPTHTIFCIISSSVCSKFKAALLTAFGENSQPALQGAGDLVNLLSSRSHRPKAAACAPSMGSSPGGKCPKPHLLWLQCSPQCAPAGCCFTLTLLFILQNPVQTLSL